MSVDKAGADDFRFSALRAQLVTCADCGQRGHVAQDCPHAGGYTEACLRLEVFSDFVIQHTARGCPADEALANKARKAADLVIAEARRVGVLPAADPLEETR